MSRDGSTDGDARRAPPPAAPWSLRLFITGASPRSTAAVANLRALCDGWAERSFEVEVIDLFIHPERAAVDQVVAAPTLIKVSPIPRRVVLGDLSDGVAVLAALGLAAPT